MKIFKRFLNWIAPEVPKELDACESCRELDCPQSKWENCERRLHTLKTIEGKNEKQNSTD